MRGAGDTSKDPAPDTVSRSKHERVLSRIADPTVHDWAAVPLPDTWPDRLRFWRPADVLRFVWHVTGLRRPPVDLPDELPGRERIPEYALQAFHNLPNGNYSKRITRGYLTGFDLAMLGHLGIARREIAVRLATCRSAVDVGCAGGKLAAALSLVGIEDVWAIDPSPYLLRHAAIDHPDVRFAQGTAEDTRFPDGRFDGVAACFLFHEPPPASLRRGLREFNRVLRLGGLLAICEPSNVQLDTPLPTLVRRFGWQGLYFRLLANLVFEPFVAEWHAQDIGAKLAEQGFGLLEDRRGMPLRTLFARKVRTLPDIEAD